MKPTKSRNMQMYQATKATLNKNVSSPLSKDLRKQYGKRSTRVIEGDSVKVTRGEFVGIDGKVSKVIVHENKIVIEGIKKEKTKGDKYDVLISPSNVVITGLNSDDKYRMNKLEGKKSEKGGSN